MLDLSFSFVDTKDEYYFRRLNEAEDRMDEMENEYMQRHFERMTSQVCNSPVASSIYADILSNLERMGDHCCNIAKQTKKYIL